MTYSIKRWQEEVYKTAEENGWHPQGEDIDHVTIIAWLALVVTEVSEAIECVRKNNMETKINDDSGKIEGFGSEMADIVIRTLDIAETLGINLEDEITKKNLYNKVRPFRHEGKRF